MAADSIDWKTLDRALAEPLPEPKPVKDPYRERRPRPSGKPSTRKKHVHRAPQSELDRLAELPLGEFLTTVTPQIKGKPTEDPKHLKPLVDELETCLAPHTGQRIFCFSVPPRHFKTVTLIHAVLMHLLRWPEHQVAYLSHTQKFSSAQSRIIKRAARDALKIKLSTESKRQDEWELAGHEGGFVARGVGGDITGRGFRLIIIDDAVKGREKAKSQADRDRIWEWIEDDVRTRLDPDGCLIIVGTRWVEDDAIGRAIENGWPAENIPALGGELEDQPLLPHWWSYEFLDKVRRETPWKFASLYQGTPRPKGAALFGEPTLYTELPKNYRVGYGVDCAYSESTRSDWSVLIRGYFEPDTQKLYIVDIFRSQAHAPAFAEVLAREFNEQPGPMIWEAGGTEKGTYQFIRQKVPKLRLKPASTGKYSRATGVAEAWNGAKVLIPDTNFKDRDGKRPFADKTWVGEFRREVLRFTGTPVDAHDDQVDALASLFRVFQQSPMLKAMKSLSAQGF